jgi:hypothetical protein
MSRPRTFLLVFLAAQVAGTGIAAARVAPPVKGARYSGATTRSKSALTMKVARSGRTVAVSLPIPPVYCERPAIVQIQKGKPARITKRGRFKGTISYEGLFTTGITAKVYFEGRFNGKRASGRVRSEFLQVTGCDGTTRFTAKKP